jgi:hypothetical protein
VARNRPDRLRDGFSKTNSIVRGRGGQLHHRPQGVKRDNWDEIFLVALTQHLPARRWVASVGIAFTASRSMTTGCVTTRGAPPENANPLVVNTARRAAAVTNTVVILRNISHAKICLAHQSGPYLC